MYFILIFYFHFLFSFFLTYKSSAPLDVDFVSFTPLWRSRQLGLKKKNLNGFIFLLSLFSQPCHTKFYTPSTSPRLIYYIFFAYINLFIVQNGTWKESFSLQGISPLDHLGWRWPFCWQGEFVGQLIYPIYTGFSNKEPLAN